MATKWKSSCLLVLGILLLCAGQLASQSFPVTTLVQVTDFSPNLEAYDDPGRVVITLINTDERPEYEALLRFSLSGPGFNIRTREEYIPFPVILRRNQPLILTGAQLRDYFDPANLSFEGISLEAILAEGGSLGEGPVSLCVEVYDFNRFFDPAVSNNGCATGFMILHRPPILVEPAGPEVEPVYPQQLRFQWQPQHAGVAARYTLEVYEDILPGMGDNLIIENTQPILLQEGLAPFYQLTPADPPLRIGSRYLVRVRAEDIAGRATFLNDGWSDIYSFVYGNEEDPDPDCPEPQRFTEQILNPQTLQLNWAEDPLVSGWTISGGAGGEEILLDAATTGFTLDNLTPAEVYTFNLCALCETGESSCVSTTVTMPEDTSAQDCGPTLVTSWFPFDDESINIAWNTQNEATGFVIRWGREMVLTPTTAPAPTTVPEQGLPGRQNNRQNNSPAPRRLGTIEGSPSQIAFNYTDSLTLPAGSTQVAIDELTFGQTYQFEVCKLCPDGSRQCTDFALTFTGFDDDCLTTLDFNRTDSTDTSLSLSWSLSTTDYSADSSFQLIWQIADGSLPPDTATLQYPSGSYTISGLLPFRAYDIQVCAECTTGQPACRDLAPFGGCPSDYEPFLVDLAFERALLGWEPEAGDSLRSTEARFKTRVAWRWDSLATANNEYFSAANYGLLPEQTSETPALRSGITYLAQIRTQCVDTVWSDWSEPVRFNTDCAVTDSLWLALITKDAATIHGFSASNAVFYAFDYRELGSSNWTTLTNLPQAELALSGLLPLTSYETRMRYWCSRGVWSDYTDIFSFTTLPPCEPPGRRLVDPIFADAAQINWQPFDRSVEVELRFRPKLAGYYYLPTFNLPWETRNTADSSVYLEELAGGALYEYQLRSNCQVNFSEWTDIEEFALLCAPPEQITITDTTYESAIVRLSGLPPAAQLSTVEYQELGDSSWLSRSALYGITALQNLDDMTYYNVRSTVTCYSGEVSEYSDTIQFRTPVKCLVPDQLIASNLQPFSAQLDWAITGTVDEWEVLVNGPIGPFVPYAQASQVQQQLNPGGTTAAGQANPGSSQLPGGISSSPQSGGGQVPGNQSSSAPTSANPRSSAAGPAAISQPPPFDGWHRFTVTDPTKLLEELRQNTDYEVVVRARCPEFGWTDYSDTLNFKTLKDCRIPGELTSTEIYRTSFRANWMPLNSFSEEYLVQLESLEPYPSGIPVESSAPAQQGVRTGGGNTSNGGESIQQGAWSALSHYWNEIYRDSLQTPENNATFNGLRANTLYRWRVKTRCDNFGWTDYSDWVLVRTDECSRPSAIVEEALDRSSMLISWRPSFGTNEYEFKYRLFDTPGADWITTTTSDSFILLTDLLTNQIYDYRVGERCQGSEQLITAPQDSFLMRRPSINNGLYVCGLENQVDLSNQIPLASLVVDDTIIAFDFPIVITSATGGGGYFSGTGDIRMPYFNKAKFSFTFDNIFVNDEYRMVGGYMEATGFGVEVLPPWADSLLADVIEGLELLDVIAQDQQLNQLDSLMACCQNSLPPYLQEQIQEVLDCYAEQDASEPPDVPDYSHCEGLLDSLMTHINEDLDSIINQLDTMIVESLTLDIIRLALDSLAEEHGPSLPPALTTYTTNRSTLEQNYPILSPASGGNNYFAESMELSPGSGGSGSNSIDQFGEAALVLQDKALSLTLEDIFVNATLDLPDHPALKVFALPLRTGDTDVFTPIHTQVEALWYGGSGGNFDQGPLVEQAGQLLNQKINFLVYD